MESDFHVGEDGVLQATCGNPSILEITPVNGRISYGWVFPKRECLAIGVAGAGYQMSPLRTIFDEFIRTVEQRTGLDLKLEERRVHFLGGDGLHSKNVLKRAILIGDAAGFVDPMMGEGIAYAMQSGVFAANVINKALNKGSYAEAVLAEYQDKCCEAFSANFGMAAWAGSRAAFLGEKLLPRISGYEIAGDILGLVARGDIGYADIPSYVLRVLPRYLPSIIQRLVRTHTNASS
jgi:2-polyprenyl-6-methoxyphenol hydroxylase-like FAD-dependent oxidoreductase